MKPLIQIANYADEQRRLRAQRRVNQFLLVLLWLISVFTAASILNTLHH
jgi:hypothetical protein